MTDLGTSKQSRVVLEAEAIHKSFGAVPVLEGVSFAIRSGEIHTLMGENGAGKSTLMNILAGVHQPDAGSVRVDGWPVRLASPQAALRQGIALIHQEPLSFPDLTVAENIFIGRNMPTGKASLVDWHAMNRRAGELLAALGVDLKPTEKVRGLSIADQQMMELAAALSQNARVLLLDEPTAALTPSEAENLFRIVRRLCDGGTAVVFISHRLPEVFAISDRITVLRDGHFIGSRLVGQTTPEDIIRMMVGRDLGQFYAKSAAQTAQTRLKVEGLGRRGCFQGVSFEVKAGEIVGMAGLVGAGRTDVGRALFGIAPADEGAISVDGKPVTIRSPGDAGRCKIAYVPEDRTHHGLFLPMKIAANIAMANLPAVSRLGWIVSRRESALAETWRQKLAIRLRSVDQPASELSGGNQQKVVLAKWLLTRPDVLILDEPTRGVDVGAKAEVHHLMADLARQGKAILMISSDLPEVLAISHRILVMREGRLVAEFPAAMATQEEIMAAATGQMNESAQRPPPPLWGRSPGTPGGWGVTSEGHKTGPNPSQPTAGPVRRKPNEGSASKWIHFRELGIATVVLLTVIIATAFQPRFLGIGNIRSVFLYIPLIVMIAMGQMMVIITRNIDLSVGSILAFAAIVVGNLYIHHPDMSLPAAAAVACLTGGLLGLLNGTLVACLRVPSIIATLGTLTAYRGLVAIYSGGREVENENLPVSLIELSKTSPIFHIPWIVLIAAAIAVVTALWLRYTRTGREVFALGSNPAAAVLRGIPVRRILLLVFTLTGVLSGLAGLLFASRFGFINPVTTGSQMELVVISAVVIGGTNVFGGSGSVLGTVLGCLLLGLVNVALPLVGVSAFWQLAIYGAAILLAASTDAWIQRRAGVGVDLV